MQHTWYHLVWSGLLLVYWSRSAYGEETEADRVVRAATSAADFRSDARQRWGCH